MTGKRRRGQDPVPSQPEGPAEPPVIIPPVPGRRQARLERRKRQRRRIGLLGGAAIAVVVLIVAGAVAFGVHHAVTNHSKAAPTQTTVLLQIEGAGHTAQTSMLLAHDTNQNQGLEVLVPARLLTEVCGYNLVDFGQVLALPNGETVSRQALSSALDNVTIDGSWLLTTTQLGQLVNAVGGITVDVDTNVVRHTGGGGGQILVPAGPNRHLTGAQAVEYATYSTSSGAGATAQLARAQQVVDAMVQALPKPAAKIVPLLSALGGGGGSTLGPTRLAGLLAGLASADSQSGHVLPTDLPVTPIEAGGASPAYRTNTAEVKSLVSQHLSASVPAGAGATEPTVELLNGVGTPGLVNSACPRLAANHLAYAGSGNASSFTNTRSTIEVPTNDISLGYRVASALRLPRSDVRRSTQDQTVADAIVVLGNDYHA